MNVFKIVLKIKFPSELAQKINLRNYKDDIDYAVEEFNQYYEYKEIKVIAILEDRVVILLKIEKDDVSAREITYFSRRLYNNRSWNRFSSQKNKLFLMEKIEKVLEENMEIVEDLKIEGKQYLIEDDKAIEALKGLILLQNIGEVNTQKKYKKAIRDIKKILIECLN